MRIPTSVQTVELTRAFWFEETQDTMERPIEKRLARMYLDPQRDSYLITGDKNTVHGRWAMTWRVGHRGDNQATAGSAWRFAQRIGTLEKAR